MNCMTSTEKVEFEYRVDPSRAMLVIESDSGFVHEYRLQALVDSYNWLKNERSGAWVLLGSINEQNDPVSGSLEEWSRDPSNPNEGFYGVTPGFRGRFSSYIPAILEQLGFVELEGLRSHNRVRAR